MQKKNNYLEYNARNLKKSALKLWMKLGRM